MPDIIHDFSIYAPAKQVFQALSTPGGLDAWWTKRSSGTAQRGAEYTLWFGPVHDWRAVVSRCVPARTFELRMTEADRDWRGTRVGFDLREEGETTQVRFHHTGWPTANRHYRISCFCWAMYLRLLKRFIEHGEIVEYDRRLDA